MRAILLQMSRVLGQPRVIFDRAGGSPYLSRWYLLGRPRMADGSDPIDRFGNPKLTASFPSGLGIYLHRFHRSDDGTALHNHPWTWARALILAGGYSEERRGEDGISVGRRLRLPGDWVRINSDDFHRVDLLEEDSWSLFVAGPKVGSWGFWDRHTRTFYEWRDFIRMVRGVAWDGSKQ